MSFPKGGSEKLELFKTGEFRQQIIAHDGKTYDVRGKWEFVPGLYSVRFIGLRHSIDLYGSWNAKLDKPEEAYTICDITRGVFGTIKLPVHEGIYYVKVGWFG
ncbi:MAG TPA: hypothetical protein VHD32_10500 [Candidatus Didemnitutus sp.]|nr:hypothetical protein [Candidatus Didemnitutus sp.]